MVEAAGVRYEPVTVGGVPGWWCCPDGAQPGARLLFAHGGGYVLGSAFPFRKIAGQIAVRARADTFIVDYPLAPEHPFPAAIDAVWSAYRGLARAPLSGLPPIRIDVGDDEVLLDDAWRYADAARAAGTPVTLAIWSGMPHVFQSNLGALLTAETSMDAIGRFLHARLWAALNAM